MAQVNLTPLTENFGVILSPSGETDSLPIERSKIADLFERYRCIVFRGFKATVDDFQCLTSELTKDFLTYQGGGFTVGPFKRSMIDNQKTLLTATGKTQDFPLPLHGEMYYLGQPPDLIWFYCAKPVEEGGETTVGDGVQIFRELSDSTARMLENRHISYRRHLRDSDWQAAFQTDSKAAVEEFCRAQNLHVIWEPDGSVVTTMRASALRPDRDGNPAFINSLLILALAEQAIVSGQAASYMPEMKNVRPDFVVRWDDGSPIELEVIQELAKISGRNEAAVSWSSGDVMLVDNRSIMHGRRASSGTERQILVRMGSLNTGAAAAA